VIRRLSVMLCALAVAAGTLPSAAQAAGSGSWSLVTSSTLVDAHLLSSTGDTTSLTLENHVSLEPFDLPAAGAVLDALGFGGGYSQEVSWSNVGSGPIVSCPNVLIDLLSFCHGNSTGGWALIPDGVPTDLELSGTAGNANLLVKPTAHSVEYDSALAAVGLALSVISSNPKGVIIENLRLVASLAARIAPEAAAYAAAAGLKDYTRAGFELLSLSKRAATLIADDVTQWSIGTLADMTPFGIELKLGLAIGQIDTTMVNLAARLLIGDASSVITVTYAGGQGGHNGPPAPKSDLIAISAGGDHSCGLVSGGIAMCWGNNRYGQLGDGTTTDSSTPVAVSGLTDAATISAGGDDTCALVSGGTVECWGYNEFGQLGNGTTADSSTPAMVAGLSDATAISVGGYDTCALLSGGSVKCWGDGALVLGDGTTTSSPTPVTVSGLTNATAIAASGQHICVLLSGGTVKCWGYNVYGYLGNGSTTDSSTPVSVSGLSGAIAISGGGSSWGADTCALLLGGTVKCWGWNSDGELGNGTTTDSYTPVSVSGLSGAIAISSGGSGWGGHTCAIMPGGTVKCWGYNRGGQLGNGTTVDSPTPVGVAGLSGATAVSVGDGHTCALVSGGKVECWGDNGWGQLGNGMPSNSSHPVTVSGLTTAIAISASGGESRASDLGTVHPAQTCSLLLGGKVECWGYNRRGQLGNGTTADSFVPVAVGGLSGAVAVSPGQDHTCALMSGGTVECWGGNSSGQLGDGTTTDGLVPVPVSRLSGARAVSSGDGFTCALVSGGTVECWGYNGDGELGNGTTADSPTPVAVDGLSGATAIAAGYGEACALISGGSVACWGGNSSGQLGSGSTSDSLAPVEVAGLTGATAISIGLGHACAVVRGSVMCWGGDVHGQLGNGTTADSPTPVAVAGLSGAIAVSAGEAHTCALLSGGTVECWGYNEFGQLGNGTSADSPKPVAVSGLSGATAVSAGGEYACALLSGGTVNCWGDNESGQLGDGILPYVPTPATVLGSP
jgi:alpha-tubulin suppressor-like RCC1 family protein